VKIEILVSSFLTNHNNPLNVGVQVGEPTKHYQDPDAYSAGELSSLTPLMSIPEPGEPADDICMYNEHEPTPEVDEQAPENYPSSSRKEDLLGGYLGDEELEEQGFTGDDLELTHHEPGGKAI